MIENYIQELTKVPSKAWVSLLWTQYNKLSEQLKEGFINLAHSMAKETENQNINTETNILMENITLTQKVSDTTKGDA
jgi:hypothetical protein